MPPLFWLTFIGYPVLLGATVSTVTAWLVRRSLQPRLDAVEVALLRLQQHAVKQDDPEVGLHATRQADLLAHDPHERYRRTEQR